MKDRCQDAIRQALSNITNIVADANTAPRLSLDTQEKRHHAEYSPLRRAQFDGSCQSGVPTDALRVTCPISRRDEDREQPSSESSLLRQSKIQLAVGAWYRGSARATVIAGRVAAHPSHTAPDRLSEGNRAGAEHSVRIRQQDYYALDANSHPDPPSLNVRILMRFARLSRRDCVMLLGASLSGLADIRSVPSQEILRIPPSGEYQPWGFDLSGADLGIKPGDDFFRYSNGAWFDHAVISPDHDTNGVDTALSDIAEGRIRDILMSGGTSVELSAREDAAKAGVFYSNFMDEARAEALDANPIAPFVRMLRQAETRADLAELMPKPFFIEIFSLSIGIDAKATNKYAIVVGQGGLGLPDRDYYLTAQFSSKRVAYLAHIAHILSLIGWETPKEFAAAILIFESAIAEATGH
jgi:hypothetical protein